MASRTLYWYRKRMQPWMSIEIQSCGVVLCRATTVSSFNKSENNSEGRLLLKKNTSWKSLDLFLTTQNEDEPRRAAEREPCGSTRCPFLLQDRQTPAKRCN